MKQIILDTNAVRYFYQIECCNGEGVRDKVMKKYYFDKQKYVQFLRTVSSISIPATTKFELFFQAYRKGEPDLLVKYNELTQHYKEAYGIDIYIINPGVSELKYHQEQLAEDLKNGLIQTEKYISPRIEHEVKLMQGLFFTLIGTISDVVYKDLEIEESVAGLVSGLIWSQMYSRLYDLYNQYYLDEELHMSIDDVDKRIDEILLESIRNAFILMNIQMNKEHAFVGKEVKAYVVEALADVESPEINALKDYLEISSKKEKLAYIEERKVVDWNTMAANKDGTFGKPVVNARILQLQMDYEFPEESLEAKMKRVMLLMEEESELKKVIKAQKIELEAATIETIKNLDEEDALRLLELKWIEPIVSGLGTLPDDVITALVSEVENLNSKYVTTYSDIEVKKESAAVLLFR